MNGKEISGEFQSLIKKDEQLYINDYEETVEKVKKSNAKYKGKPVPFTYNPMFFSVEEERELKEIGESVIRIGEKLTEAYINDKNYRALFSFPRLIEDLILRENKYEKSIPMARVDVFYKGNGDFKLCEINTDGSSAMNEDNTIANILLESMAFKAFSKEFSLKNRELIDSWVNESLKIYYEWRGKIENPNVAIVDFIESGTTAEFQEFQKAYEKKGLNCIIVDPRELTYKDKALYFKDYKIDLVYRRIVTFELLEKAVEIPDFLKAYMADVMCTVGTIRSQVIHNKLFFKLVKHPMSLEYLDEKEVEFVKAHFPYTEEFGVDKKRFEEVKHNKDKYIIKPMDLNASQGVYIGLDHSQEEWEEKINKAWDKEYLFQEFISPPQRDFIIKDNGGFSVDSFKAIVGIFVYSGKYQGLYTRISQNNIISGVTHYFTAPNIIASKI